MVIWNSLEIGCPRYVCGWGAWRCAAFLVCCGLLFACGCKKKEKVYTDRANDEAYIELLQEQVKLQKGVAVLQMETALKMTQCVQRVQAELPKDADEGALNAALAADAEWLALEAQAKEQDEESQRLLSEGRKIIQLRMQDEQQARLDVKAGKAVAADQPKDGKDGKRRR